MKWCTYGTEHGSPAWIAVMPFVEQYIVIISNTFVRISFVWRRLLFSPDVQVKAWTPADARLHWSFKSLEEGYVVKVTNIGRIKWMSQELHVYYRGSILFYSRCPLETLCKVILINQESKCIKQQGHHIDLILNYFFFRASAEKF